MRTGMDYNFEDLANGIRIAVSKQHTFGTDAFLLTEFASPRRKDTVCDLGTGCGIIPLLMDVEMKPSRIVAVDIQPQAIEQLNISIEQSRTDNIRAYVADIKKLWEDCPDIQKASFDVVTCNPPYKASGAGIESELTAEKIARHEVLCDIYDICRTASQLLKFGGRLCLCNRPERLADVTDAMRKSGIEPKSLRFVSKTPDDAPWLFLIEGKKGSKPFLKVLPQLCMNSPMPVALMKYYRKDGNR